MTCFYCQIDKFTGFWWRAVFIVCTVLGGLRQCDYHAEFYRERDRMRRERARADARRP